MNRYQVTAPERGFSGESCGVVFKDGAAVVSDETKQGRAAIEYFRRRGYALTPEGADQAADDEIEPQTPKDDRLFDPSQHDAPEVIAYLDSLINEDTQDTAEFDRVIAAERDGKARKTVLARGEQQQEAQK